MPYSVFVKPLNCGGTVSSMDFDFLLAFFRDKRLWFTLQIRPSTREMLCVSPIHQEPWAGFTENHQDQITAAFKHWCMCNAFDSSENGHLIKPQRYKKSTKRTKPRHFSKKFHLWTIIHPMFINAPLELLFCEPSPDDTSTHCPVHTPSRYYIYLFQPARPLLTFNHETY